MKILLLAVLFMGLVFSSIAQTQVVNGSFENWTKIILDQAPTGYWSSSSYNMFQDLPPSVFQDSVHVHSGKYAVTVMTVASIHDTANGIVVYTSIPPNKGPDSIWGGFPYSIIPDSIEGYYMYHCAKNDSSFIAVMLKKNGVRLTFDIFNVYGDQATYKKFAYKLTNPGVNPDTIIIAFGSSNDLYNNKSKNAGNWLTVDDISFAGPSKPMPAIPNNGFENWQSTSYQDPTSWNSFNIFNTMAKLPPYVTKYSPGYSGNYAVSIKTSRFDQINIDSTGILTTGTIFGGLNGGFKIDTNYVPDSIGFYYKYFNSFSTSDSALFWITFSKYNYLSHQSNNIQFSMNLIPASASYKFKSFRFNFSGLAPDTCNITLCSSNLFKRSVAGIGNELVVDLIAFYYMGLGIPAHMVIQNNGKIYPNPGNDFVNLDFILPVNNKVSVYLTDLAGHILKSNVIEASEGLNHYQLSVSDIPPGIYFYIISSPVGKFSGKLEINR
jgi:hypothetical protein